MILKKRRKKTKRTQDDIMHFYYLDLKFTVSLNKNLIVSKKKILIIKITKNTQIYIY